MPQEYIRDQLLILNRLNEQSPCSILDLKSVLPVWSDSILTRMLQKGLVAEGLTSEVSWSITPKGRTCLFSF